MTTDHPQPDSGDQVAAAQRRIENCRESITHAMAAEAEATDPNVAERFRRYATKKRVQMIDAALDLCRLQDWQAPRAHRPTADELRHHEQRLGLPEGTFWHGVREPWVAEAIRPQRGLELAKELAEAELRMERPPRLDPGYAPAIVRVCRAVVVGTLVGAPLGALAIPEAVLNKMVEAARVTGLSDIAAEIAAPLSELTRPHGSPAAPGSVPRPPATDRGIGELPQSRWDG